MIIRRNMYLSRLIERKHNGLVKIITGIRRCGKSYLLFKLFREHLESVGVDKNHIVEVQLDTQAQIPQRNPYKLYDYIVNRIPPDGGMTYVMIDEIQFCRKVLAKGVKLKDVAKEDRDSAYVTFYDILNDLMKRTDVDLYVTGSNSRMLSKDIATNFRDRGFEIRLFPLSFGEYLEMSGLEKAEAFERYLVWGGMPMAALERNDSIRAQYLKDLFGKVYLKDIRERHKLKSDLVAERVVDQLCSAIGSLTNSHKIKNAISSQGYAETTDRTLKKYLDYFEEAFLFSKAQRYDVRGKKYLSYPQKYYAMDVGLRNARLNFRETDEAHLMENVIYNELLSRGCNVDVGVVEVMRTDKNGKRVQVPLEIDFIVNIGPRKIYVQSAYRIPDEEKRRQETASLRESRDFFRKIVVVNGFKPPIEDADGIVHVGVIPFLLDRTILTGGDW